MIVSSAFRLFIAGIPLNGHDPKSNITPKDPKRPKVAVFFADSHTLFGAGWLYPLLNTMLKYEGTALTYPAIDILVAKSQEETSQGHSLSWHLMRLGYGLKLFEIVASLSDMEVVQADEAVSAFDWSHLLLYLSISYNHT
jgi:hypothetical protein